VTREPTQGRRWFEQVWNQRRREAIAEMLTPDSVIHDGGTDTTGAGGLLSVLSPDKRHIPDLHVNVQDTIAEGDKVCVRWSRTAKHTGDGLGIRTTGVTIHITDISILRVAGGKLVEGWPNWGMLGMMEQIRGSGKSATYIGPS
jgi:predicted ester cyclase